jgi:catechol 2,3-dioxygenase-like lactoylglutathione lyase family enzyme
MDYETVSAADFGAALHGLGLNLLVRDVVASVAFLNTVFGMTAHRQSADFAILRYGDQAFQLHRDGTFADHPLLGLLPENPPRGAGIELRLYDTDPDHAAHCAETAGGTILQAPANKPHGLRETVILDADGYAWVPSRPLTVAERAAL